jgi:hypothetical protein
MSESPSQPRSLFDAPPDDVTRYRGLSGLAVAALLAGLASPLALAAPLGWVVPGAGLLLGSLALLRIARAEPAPLGRKAALAGMALAALFAAAGVSRWYVGDRLLAREAARFAAHWFDALRQGNAADAWRLTFDPKHRWPAGMDPRQFDPNDPHRGEQLEKYRLQPAVRALLALGPKAQVRLYETADQGDQDHHPWVQLTYAVTCDEPPGTSFFLTLTMDRFIIDGRADWRLLAVQGDLPPGV